jgi:hypothetical protein
MDAEVRRRIFMNGRIRSFLTVLAVLLAAGSLWGHHSFSPVFDVSKKFTVTGTLAKVDWRNPHIALFVEVTGERGQAEDWVMESEAPKSLQAGRAVSKTDFQKAIGQPVTVEAYRARDGSRYGWIQQITLPDGRVVQLEHRFDQPERQPLPDASNRPADQ